MPSLLHRLRSARLFFLAPPLDAPVPFWESRPPRPTRASRLRVLWNGTQVSPAPVLVRDPPDFDPTR